MKTLAMLLVCFMLLGAALYQHARTMEKRAAVFFEERLVQAQFSGELRVGRVQYVFLHGRLGVDLAPSHKRFAVLQAAYATSLVRTLPLLALPSENTDDLRNALEDIDASMKRIADIQTTKADATAIRDHLYPIGFLSSMADLEDARRAYVQQPNRDTYRKYRQLQRLTVRIGYTEARQFSQALDAYIDDEQFKLLVLGGEMTNDSLRAGGASIVARFEDLRRSLDDLTVCLRGKVERCPEAPLPSVGAAIPSYNAEQKVRDVLRISEEAYGKEPAIQNLVVGLPKSVCFGNTTGPYYFTLSEQSDSTPIRLKYRNDLYFLRTDTGAGDTLRYVADTFGVRFSRFEPTAYYNCADVARDLGSVVSTHGIVQFARAHPSIAPEKRTPLLQLFVYAEDAEAFLHVALSDTHALSHQDREDLRRLALALAVGGGLDILLGEVADVLAIDIALYDQGVPFELDAKTLFLTHSAFTSLFLGHNRSAGVSDVNVILPSVGAARSGSKLERYSKMKETMTRQDIIENIRGSADFEGTLR